MGHEISSVDLREYSLYNVMFYKLDFRVVFLVCLQKSLTCIISLYLYLERKQNVNSFFSAL